MLDWAMAHPAFKTQLFRFVDVFPATDRRRRRAPPPRPSTSTAPTSPRRSTSASTSPSTCRSATASTASGGPPEHRPDGRAVHRRPDRRPRRSTGCTACGGRGARTPSTCSARRRSSTPRPTATRPGSSSCCDALADARRRTGRPTTTSSATTSGRCPRVNVSIKPTALATHYEPLAARARPRAAPRRASARSCGWPASAARTCTSTWSTTTPRTSRSQLFRELLDEDEFADLARRHRHPGVPEGLPRRPRRPRSRGRRSARAADHRAAGEGRVLGHRDRARQGRGLAGAGVRAQGRDRRQLRALRPAAARPPRRGAGRVRHPQPALARLRVTYARRRGIPDTRLRDPDALRHGRADARRRPAPRPAAAGLRAGRRAGAGHGVPRAPAAREHVATRASCATASPRAATLDELVAPPAVDRAARHRAAAPRPTTDAERPGAVRARAGRRVAAGDGAEPTFGVAVDTATDRVADRRARADRRRAGPHRRRRSTSVDPGHIDRVVATSASCTAADADARRRRGRARRRAAGGAPRRVERAAVLFRAAEWLRAPARRDRRARGVRGRQAVGPGRRRRVRGDRLLRVLRPRGAAPRRRRRRACSRRRARPTACATRARASPSSSRRGTSRWPSPPG